jgi:hypothetical protein
MDEGFIIPIIALAIFGGIFLYNYFFSRNAQINRRLKKAPWKSIAQVKNGETVKVVGTIFPIDKELTAPLSKRKCSHYFVNVEQKKKSGKHSHWEEIIREEETSKFLVKDGERYAYIHDHRIMSNIVIDENYSSGTFNDPTVLLDNYLAEHGHKSEGFFGFNKSLKYEEGILESGEQVSVLGEGNWQDADQLGLPAEYGKVLSISAADDLYVYLSDDPETTVRNEIKPKEKPGSKKRQRKYYRTPNSTIGH